MTTATLFDLPGTDTITADTHDQEPEHAVPFRIRVAGRTMSVTVWRSFTSCDDDWCPVDVRDVAAGMESQAIIDAVICQDTDALIREDQFRDCCRSVYGNATRWKGDRLPEDFTITPLISDRGVMEVLGASATAGDLLTLPGQLDRELYEHVARLIETAGGKWNRSRRGHVFPGADAGDVVDQLIASGGRAIGARQALGYFPTPAPVVARMLEYAGLEPWMDVLEPSAGDGAIAATVAPLVRVVDCIEIDPGRAGRIRAGGYARLVHTADFLAVAPKGDLYHRVIMNPPFGKRADLAHVTHALRFLMPGGRLVAVMSAGVLFRQDKATREFRDMLSRTGGWEELEPGAFKVSGTDVRTVIVTIFA